MEHIRLTLENFFIVDEADAFKSQTQEYDESRRFGAGSLKDRKGRAEESELQVSRPGLDETVKRKASEHKSPFGDDVDSLTDMENIAWPEWEQTPYNWKNYGGYPGYAYYPPESSGYAGWGPRSRYYPSGYPYPEQPGEELRYLKGCVLSGSNIITDCTKTYKYSFGFLAGDIVGVRIDGPATLVSPKIKPPENRPDSISKRYDLPELETPFWVTPLPEQSYYDKKWYKEHRIIEYNKYPPDIIIRPHENAEYGSEITITVKTKLVKNNGMAFDGWCIKKIKVFCGCRDAVPEIYATGGATTMGASEALDMWVNSLDFPNIYAVPPFKWSLSGGSGFSLSKPETNDEYEVNVLSTGVSPSGTATVSVIDACDESDTYEVAFDCCGLGLTPVISGADTVSQSSSITLTSTETCPPYTWTIDQTIDADGSGFSIDQSGTSCTLKASASACGGVVVTVTDDCGNSDTHRVRCPDSGAWSAITYIYYAAGEPIDFSCDGVPEGDRKSYIGWWGPTSADVCINQNFSCTVAESTAYGNEYYQSEYDCTGLSGLVSWKSFSPGSCRLCDGNNEIRFYRVGYYTWECP